MSDWQGRSTYTPAQRRRILARYPICVACQLAPSTIADHRIPHSELTRQGLDPNDEANGQGMCCTCHEAKTHAERLAGIARQPRARRRPEKHPGLL